MSLTAIIIGVFSILWTLIISPLIIKALKKYNLSITSEQLEMLKNIIIEAIHYVEEYTRNASKNNTQVPSETKKSMAIDYVRDHIKTIPALKEFSNNFDKIKPIISDKINSYLNEIRK